MIILYLVFLYVEINSKRLRLHKINLSSNEDLWYLQWRLFFIGTYTCDSTPLSSYCIKGWTYHVMKWRITSSLLVLHIHFFDPFLDRILGSCFLDLPSFLSHDRLHITMPPCVRVRLQMSHIICFFMCHFLGLGLPITRTRVWTKAPRHSEQTFFTHSSLSFLCVTTMLWGCWVPSCKAPTFTHSSLWRARLEGSIHSTCHSRWFRFSDKLIQGFPGFIPLGSIGVMDSHSQMSWFGDFPDLYHWVQSSGALLSLIAHMDSDSRMSQSGFSGFIAFWVGLEWCISSNSSHEFRFLDEPIRA